MVKYVEKQRIYKKEYMLIILFCYTFVYGNNPIIVLIYED